MIDLLISCDYLFSPIHDDALFSFRALSGKSGTNNHPIDFAVRHLVGRLQRELGSKNEDMEKQPMVNSKNQPQFQGNKYFMCCIV